jgi:hypothetical protein
VWVAIATFETREEAIAYMIARQTERRNIDRATILNALLNATLYTRGGARDHGGKVTDGTLKQDEPSAASSLQDIAETLDVSRRTVARYKRDYFDQMTLDEKISLTRGDTDVESVIEAIDDRREKPAPQSKIARFFALVGFSEDETRQWLALSRAKGNAPRALAAEVLRAALEQIPVDNDGPATPAPASGDSKPEPVTLDLEVLTVGETVGEPLALPPPSHREATGDEPKEPAKEKDWKQWHECQKQVLWHLHMSGGPKSQAETALEYHELEKKLMGDKSHTLKAAEHEVSRLVKQYANVAPAPLTSDQFEAAMREIQDLVVD